MASTEPPFTTATSAKTSLKRARHLFVSSSDEVVIPLRNDPNIHKLAIARRIRMHYPVIPKNDANIIQEAKSETAKVVKALQSEQIERLRNGSNVQQTTAASNSTLLVAIGTQTQPSAIPKNTGALVIHREVDFVTGYGLPNTASKSTTPTTLALPGQKVAHKPKDQAQEKPTGILVNVSTLVCVCITLSLYLSLCVSLTHTYSLCLSLTENIHN